MYDDEDFENWYKQHCRKMLYDCVAPYEIIKAAWRASRRRAMFDASFGCILAIGLIGLYIIASTL